MTRKRTLLVVFAVLLAGAGCSSTDHEPERSPAEQVEYDCTAEALTKFGSIANEDTDRIAYTEFYDECVQDGLAALDESS
jgi:hypothetical protein